MKHFLNLSPKASEGLDKPIFENAKRLRASSKLIAEVNQSYSTATSLLILSSEEAIKALLVKFHSEGLKVYQIKGSKRFFSDHKIRHEIAQLIEMGIGFIELVMDSEKRGVKPHKSLRFKKVSKLLDGVLSFLNKSKIMLDAASRINMLSEFNSYKNSGLYVDFQGHLLEPINEIEKTKYEEVKQITDRLFKSYQFITILYDSKSNNHISQEKINTWKVILKTLIDDAILDKELYEFGKKY